MDLTLRRLEFKESGIFGEILSVDGKHLFHTLEHAYPHPIIAPEPPSFYAKVPPGRYTCARGVHRLKDLVLFTTFMLLKVPGHSGILFHAGNFNKDSEGCILLGKVRITDGVGRSRDAFREFMALQDGVNMFDLEVV